MGWRGWMGWWGNAVGIARHPLGVSPTCENPNRQLLKSYTGKSHARRGVLDRRNESLPIAGKFFGCAGIALIAAVTFSSFCPRRHTTQLQPLDTVVDSHNSDPSHPWYYPKSYGKIRETIDNPFLDKEAQRTAILQAQYRAYDLYADLQGLEENYRLITRNGSSVKEWTRDKPDYYQRLWGQVNQTNMSILIVISLI